MHLPTGNKTLTGLFPTGVMTVHNQMLQGFLRFIRTLHQTIQLYVEKTDLTMANVKGRVVSSNQDNNLLISKVSGRVSGSNRDNKGFSSNQDSNLLISKVSGRVSGSNQGSKGFS